MKKILLLSIFILSACNPILMSDEEKIEQLIQENISAAEEENVENYINTLFKKEDNQKVIANMNKMFKDFDLDYELISIDELTIEDEEAYAYVTNSVIAKKVSKDYTFSDSTITSIYSFKKKEGSWKIVDSNIHSIEPINK